MVKLAGAVLLLACVLLVGAADATARRLADAAPAPEAASKPEPYVFGPVLSVTPEGGDLASDLLSYDFACPAGEYLTGLDVRGNNFEDGAPVIAAIGRIYCSKGAEVGAKVPLAVVRTDKWTPRAPKDVGYSGINLRAGSVIDALSLELTNGSVQPEGEELFGFGGSGGAPMSLQCPPGYWITGLYGQTGQTRVATLGLRCREANSQE